MVGASFTFLTPWAGLLALLAVLPLAAFAAGARRAETVRAALGLRPAQRASHLRHGALLAGIVVLLALAAMQPALRTHDTLRERTDAQVFVVLDTSRSMAAAASPTVPTRLARAKTIALRLGSQLGDVPVGVATFTDRVLPDLFPTADHAAFDSAVSAVGIEDPPPRDVNPVATTFDALSALATQGFFPASAHKRVVLLVTDGESAPFDPAGVASSLLDHGIRLAVIRVGGAGERVWDADGRAEAAYRADPAGARRSVASLDDALGERPGADPLALARRALGRGPSTALAVQPRTRTLAPLAVLLALALALAAAIDSLGRPHATYLAQAAMKRRES
ncbi:MAG TPA: vWA domain-containing protein [Gaiellaceae bacterium]|nr:vWA domain-containing protein [Gaiellaceae bacterium]